MAIAKVVKLIYTQERVGKGVDGDPVRLVDQLFTLDGHLVAECDNNNSSWFNFGKEKHKI